MTNYYDIQAASASGLKVLNRSPLHYWARYIDPNREPHEPTDAQLLGQRVHCAILEPAEFDNRYTVIPEGLDRRTKEGKQIWQSILDSGKEPIKNEQMQQIKAMADAFRTHRVSRVLFDVDHAILETPLFWNDADTGASCKAKPDYHILPCAQFPRGLIVDLKTTSDASPVEFARQSWNLDMHLQAAMYPEGYQRVYGVVDRPDFLWGVVENKPPYAVMYYTAPASLIEYGRDESKRLIAIYQRCITSGVWPGYGDEVQELVLPAWAEREIDGNGETDVEFVE